MSGAASLIARGATVRRSGRAIVDRVDLALRPGELVALVGPNGSGKSTLLRAMLGIEALDGGVVTLGDTPLAALGAKERARALTMVTHGLAVDFGVSVREIVALGRYARLGALGRERDEDRAAIERALADVDATHLGDRAYATLSAGEKQRVALARALCQEAPLLLLDEPTANLDVRHQLEAVALLRGFVDRGGGALVAMHDLSLVARVFDRVVVIDRGAIVGDGAPAAVLDEARLAATFGVEARIERRGDRIESILPIGAVSARDRDERAAGAPQKEEPKQ